MQKKSIYTLPSTLYKQNLVAHTHYIRGMYLRFFTYIGFALGGLLFCTTGSLLAQKKNTVLPSEVEEKQQEENKEDPLLGLPEPAPPPVAPKIKPIPQNMFFGVKASRKAQYKGQGNARVKEIFYILRKKDKEEIPPFVPYVYWYHPSRRQIMYTSRNKARKGPLLHGKYQKKWKKLVIEERYFYYGTPHGRWVWISTKDVLLDKRYYFKGWPTDAQKSYYDVAQTQLREVIPIQHKERNGPYYAFHRNGKIAAIGLYFLDQKIRTWHEYYENGQPKRDLKYPDKPFGEERPYILKEWNPKGRVIYARNKKKTKKRTRR